MNDQLELTLTIRWNDYIDAHLQEHPIEVEQYVQAASAASNGAVTMFLGQVRDHDHEADGQAVTEIEYAAHPDAQAVLEREVTSVVRDAFAVVRPDQPAPTVIVIHRIGRIPVGQAALLVVVGSPHRFPGMNLVPAIVERVKATMPVWKKQSLEDGSDRWSNLP